MNQLAAHHLNAFNIQQSEDESLASNMSGTFNKMNNSLKINQRRQKKTSNSQSDKDSIMSENESLRSFKAEIQQDIRATPHPETKPKLPPPPSLVSSLAKHFQTQVTKNMPNLVKLQEKPAQVLEQKSNSSSKIKGGILSPPSKREELDRPKQTVSIKEDIPDSTFNNHKLENDHSISQDQVPLEDEEKFIIKINVKHHSNIPTNIKLPNPNYNILEQAKYLLMAEIESQPELDHHLTEESLSRMIKQIHIHLMKQKDLDQEKLQGDYNKQVMSLQAQLQMLNQAQARQNLQAQGKKNNGLETPNAFALNSTNSHNLNESQQNQQIDIQQTEEFKKMREENQELRMRAQFLEQDLQFQAQKTKDLQIKYENEIDNLRSQLKGSQSEQFVKQQIEHKQLIEDNSVLMREVKILQDKLKEEQQRVVDLFEDAQQVRDEIMKEMSEFEKVKKELNRVKSQNRNLKKKLHDQSIEFSEYGQQEEGSDEDKDEYSLNNHTLGMIEEDASMIKGRKKKVEQVSVAISRPESLLSLANGFNQRLEEVIEEKSKSIINILTKSHVQNQNSHPYALNYQYNQNSPYQQHMIYSEISHAQKMRSSQPAQSKGQIVEMSLYESENGGLHQESSGNLENHHSPNSSAQRVLKANTSDLQILKHKIKEVRDKHNSQIHDQSSKNLNSQSSKSFSSHKQSYPQNQEDQMINVMRLQTQPSHHDTLKAINSGVIHQEGQPLNIYYRETHNSSEKPLKVNFINHDDEQKEEDAFLQNQFKTPVWTNQFGQGESDDDEEEDYYQNQEAVMHGKIRYDQQQLQHSFNQEGLIPSNKDNRKKPYSP